MVKKFKHMNVLIWSTIVKKIAVFTYRSPHFCFTWRRPCDYHAICCMDGKTIQCLPKRSQHVPIYLQKFPSYTMQCQKIAIFTTFLFHLETPLCHHAKCCMDGKRIRCLLSSIVPELYEAMQKNRVSSGDAHGNHAKCCMDGKWIRCLQIVLLHMPI